MGSEDDGFEIELRERLRDLHTTVARLEASIDTHRAEAVAEVEQLIADERTALDNRASVAKSQVDAKFTEAARTVRADTEAAVTQLAPGVASTAWTDTREGDAPVRPASYVRFGTVTSGASALAPFLEHPGWLLRGPSPTALEQINNVLLRTVAQTPLRFLRLRVFDPRIEGALGAFAKLREADPASFPPGAHSTSDLNDLLSQVVAQASVNAEQMGSHHARTLGELWEDEGRAVAPYTIVVVLSYPLGIDEATQNMLVRLAESGYPRGVSLLVQRDEDAKPARGVKPKDLEKLLVPFESVDDRWISSVLPDTIQVRHDLPAPREVARAIVQDAVHAVGSDTGPVVPLSELLAKHVDNPWTDTADDVIEAVIGRRGQEPLSIGLRSENPPHPNLLIGGAVGQGKSNLLLDIIYSLAVRYSPDELEMLLLDFKQGLEFKRFDKDADGENWLPHARVLSLESNKPFGLAVLEFVSDELERRAEVFNDARCNGITEYRARTGLPMPRMLLIIDEFQVLFDGDDDLTDQAVRLFENLAKQGRAFGIHILLSSQTVSGISGLRAKGESIFAQFPIRISLKNTREESEAILSRQNTAAAELTYRGEVVVNRNLGLASNNERAVAAYAEPSFLVDLQSRLWRRDTRRREPWVFLGRSWAQWPAAPVVSEESEAWIGRPIAITDRPVTVRFDRDIDQSIAVVGTGDREAEAVLGAVVATATANWGSSGRVVVLDGNSASAEDPEMLRAALDRCRLRDQDVQVIDRDAITRFVVDTLPGFMTDNSAPTLIVALALQKVADFADEQPRDPEDEFSYETVSAAEVLREVATRGGTVGLYLVGWWPNLRAVASHLSFDHAGVGTYVMLRAGLDDLRSVAGPHMNAPEGTPRVVVVDRSSHEGAQVVVPFEPLTTEVTR
ncbi:FtsK/SpoIIIE domain-containing protein [Rhodococcus pyridinivorans]|uniref:FtsK domain-containing protein n=1 Tax=Rhodococcus pyridinivorans TaxID=103816 RepID=A0A7M2XS91_9NOCA|nr:FtsK/SpoIIIE domain-containing protein [Rhodococcus pyridinivorans]QOW00144.1 hypothetical protein INP59_07280 [Rhodococcus pyridinivorans]WMM74041.1 FtsK/SpoIIIE domain-containing protein [Rhodococcus pyridinivorans]